MCPTVLNGIRTILSDSKLPEEFWAKAAKTVVYTLNRLTTRNNKSQTRFELFLGRKPNLSNLRIFGQNAVVRQPDTARDGKLAERGKLVRFVGYTDRHNTYRFYENHPVERIITACDAKFLMSNEKDKEEAENVITILDDESTLPQVELELNNDTTEHSSTAENQQDQGSINNNEDPKVLGWCA